MIVEYLRYEIDTSRQKKFVSDYLTASKLLLASPYALSFELCQSVEDPGQFIIRIEWTSAEDHLEKFRGGKEFKAFFPFVQPYFKDIKEMRHYTPLDHG